MGDDGLPATSADQSCAFCGAGFVGWVHPLAPDRIRYRRGGKGFTLPTFFTACDGCEELVTRGADDDLLVLMGRNDEVSDSEWAEYGRDARDEHRQLLAVFRLADLGGRRLGTEH